MNILGVSCGRRMGNSEVLLKEALMGAEEVSGADAEIIRLTDLSIKPCKGCEVCMMTRVRTGTMGSCVTKDDHLSFLAEKLTDCEGLILGAPTYYSRPPSLWLMAQDRMGAPDLDTTKKHLKSSEPQPSSPSAAATTSA
jgi:multimeric flavodoxin WrbA